MLDFARSFAGQAAIRLYAYKHDNDTCCWNNAKLYNYFVV